MEGVVEVQRMAEPEWRLNPVDILALSVVGTLALLTLLMGRRLGENTLWLFGIYATLLIATVLVARFARRGRWIRVVHDFFAIITIVVVFSSLGPLIDAFQPQRWDSYFADLDAVFFPGVVTVWRELFGRPDWFTDLIYVAYVSYYPMPLALAIIFYVGAHPRERFDEIVFTVALTFFGSYVGYFLLPTYGPRIPLDLEPRILGGGGISEAIRGFIHVAERTKMDAFPSGHTAVALVCLRYARWCGWWITALYVVLVTGVVLATVYLYYHYVTDVLAGAVLAGICLMLGPKLMAWTDAVKWQRMANEVAGRWRALTPKS